MKAFSLVAVFALGGVMAASADLTITQKIDGLGQPTVSVTKYKDGKTRMDVPPDTTIIMDSKTGEAISLLPAQKRYLKAPASVVAAAVEGLQGEHPRSHEANTDLVPSGRKETISGFAAEEYRATKGGINVVLWITRTMPDYETATKELAAAFTQGPLAAMTQNFGLDLAHLPGFPVRTETELRPGQKIIATLVSVSTAPIPDSDFQIPADYRPVAVPELTPRVAVPGNLPTR